MAVLDESQLAVLNNFIYMETDKNPGNPLSGKQWDDLWDDIEAADPGTTLGDVIDTHIVKTGIADNLANSGGTTTLTTGSEWSSVVQSILNDRGLRDLKLGGVDSYTAHGSKAVCFIGDDGQPYVVFKGTGGIEGDTEWPDNFTGGATVSTEQQNAALDYIEEVYRRFHKDIIVSGHSKGGNKAQFVTIMSDHVSAGYSFDGQGFSPEFVQLYADRTSRRSNLIICYNHKLDPVSTLLINIAGNVYYVDGDYPGISDYAKTHAPITLMQLEGGALRLRPFTEQSKFAQALHDLTVYLAQVALPGDFEKILGVLAVVFEKGVDKPDLAYLETSEGAEALGLLAAYLEHYDGYDALLASLTDLFSESDVKVAGGLIGAMKLCPGLELALLMLVLAGAGVGVAKMGAWLASHAELLARIDEVRRRRSGTVAARVAAGARTGAIGTNQVRDFSQAKLDEMISIIREIQSEPFFDPTRWDIWYRAEAFFGRLNPSLYQGNMRTYYRKVMDINDTSVAQMQRIFKNVEGADKNYAATMGRLANEASTLANRVRQLAR